MQVAQAAQWLHHLHRLGSRYQHPLNARLLPQPPGKAAINLRRSRLLCA